MPGELGDPGRRLVEAHYALLQRLSDAVAKHYEETGLYPTKIFFGRQEIRAMKNGNSLCTVYEAGGGTRKAWFGCSIYEVAEESHLTVA